MTAPLLTALLVWLLLSGLAFAAWIALTGDSVEHRGCHRCPSSPRRYVAAGELTLARVEAQWP